MTPAQIRKAKSLVDKYNQKMSELRNVTSPRTGVTVAVFDLNGKDIHLKQTSLELSTLMKIQSQHKKFMQFLRKTGGAA